MRVTSVGRLIVGSLVFAVCSWNLAGCGPKPVANEKKEGQGEEHGHHHHHDAKGPHDGALVVLGDEAAHLEIVLDSDTGKLTAYVLDAEAKGAVHVTQQSLELAVIVGSKEEAKKKGEVPDPQVVKLDAVSPSDKGETTEFAGQSDALKGVKEFDAVLTSITISGKEFKATEFNYPEGNEHHHH